MWISLLLLIQLKTSCDVIVQDGHLPDVYLSSQPQLLVSEDEWDDQYLNVYNLMRRASYSMSKSSGQVF